MKVAKVSARVLLNGLALVSATLACATTPPVANDSATSAPEADHDWNRLSEIVTPVLNDSLHLSPQPDAYREYLHQGLNFWRRYPDDPRKFQWFLTATNYVNAAALNPGAKARWRHQYSEMLKPTFMASPQVTDEQRERLMITEGSTLANDIEEDLQGSRPSLHKIVQAILDFAAQPLAREDQIGAILSQLYFELITAHIDPREQRAVFQKLAKSSNYYLQRNAAGMDQKVLLTWEPLELRLTGIDGKLIDLSRLRGKIVLVDIWAISCSGCVEQMPNIRTVYDKYHDRGFEVVGLCLMLDAKKEGAREEAKALAVLNKTGGIAWTNALVGGNDYQMLTKRYGVLGVGLPATWLLGKDGKLVTAEAHGQELERQVRRLTGNATANNLGRF